MARGEVRREMAIGAARSLAEKGLDGTSFAEVLERTGSPRGSTYHHFPGGKDELVAAALDVAGAAAIGYLEAVRGKPADVVIKRFVELWRNLLESTELRSGCAVVAVTVATDSPDLLAQAGVIFANWSQQLASVLVDGGLTKRAAVELATVAIASTEGAVALCRAQRSIAPLDVVGKHLTAIARMGRAKAR